MSTLAVTGALPARRLRLFHALLWPCVAVLLLRRFYDPDLWYHLVLGREVWQTGRIPAEEFYILPNLGLPGAFHEWGHGLVLFLLHQAGGLPLLAAANVLVGVLVLWLLAQAAFRDGQPSAWVYAVLVLFVFWLVEFRINYRPETMLYLALAATVAALEASLAGSSRRWLWLPPAAALVLTQCHPSAAILLIVAGAYLVQVLRTEGLHSPLLRGLLLCCAGIAAAGCLNPYGAHQFLLPFHMAAAKEVIADVNEFLPAMATPYRLHFLLALAAAAAALAVRRRLVDVLLIGFFAFLAFRHVRNIALLGMVLAVPLGRALATATAGWAVERMRLLGVALLAVLALAIGRTVIRVDDYWGYGLSRTMLPVDTAEKLASLVPRGRVMNFYHFGGYLAWRLGGTHGVMVDGRNFTLTPALVLHDTVFRADPGWQEALQRFRIDAVLTRATLPYSGAFIPLVDQLLRSPEWKLVARDDASLLWVRATNPAPALPEATVWKHALAELQQSAEENPTGEEIPKTRRLIEERLRALGAS